MTDQSNSIPALRVRGDALRAGLYRVSPRSDGDILYLDRNEGPCAPEAAQWLAEVAADSDVRQYPDASGLERELASRLDLPDGSVLVTAGGDEAIDRCARLVGGTGRRAIVPSPTFEMIPRALRLSGCAVDEVEWPDEACFPIAAFRSALSPQTVLTALVSPDNPTGRMIPEDIVREVSALHPEVVSLIDVAYREFDDRDLIATARTLPNTVCIGTFSKAYGLAALRVGYAVASPEVIAYLRACGGPFTVSALSIAAATRMLCDTPQWIGEGIARVDRERTKLADLLRQGGWSVTQPHANFVFARRSDAARVAHQLQQAGIVVRTFADPHLSDALRITCPGNAERFGRLERALRGAAAIAGDAPALQDQADVRHSCNQERTQ